jgi:outer membrane protein assembly factor BamB
MNYWRTFCFMLVSFGAAAQALADDWPNYRGPTHRGVSNENNWSDQWLSAGPKVLWRSNVGVGFSACAVVNNRLFTLGNQDSEESLVCLDASRGSVQWKHTYECDLDDRFFEGGPTSTPTVDADRVYSLSRQGDLFCLNVVDGTLHWSMNIAASASVRVPGWGFAGSPVIVGDRLILNAGESGLALNKHTGEIIWKSADMEAGYMTPLPFQIGQKEFALIASGKFYQCVDLENGRVVWKHRWLTTYGCNAASPIVDGSKAFISSGYGRGAALLEISPTAAQVVWTNKDMQNQLNSCVLVDGYLFGFNGDEGGEVALTCMEFATGNVMWKETGFGSGSLLASNGRLIVLSQDGELVVAPASPKTYRPTARAKVLDGKCWTVPVLSQSRIYCRDAGGNLVCLDVHSQP